MTLALLANKVYEESKIHSEENKEGEINAQQTINKYYREGMGGRWFNIYIFILKYEEGHNPKNPLV